MNESEALVNGPSSLNLTLNEEVLDTELSKFRDLHNQCVELVKKMELCLLALGLFGNILALITLVKSTQMQTPSFVYHKVLVTAYLIYCTNFVFFVSTNAVYSIPGERQQLRYSNPIVAYYSGVLNRVISSVCGYLSMYASLAISLDRFFALVLLEHYCKFNRYIVAGFWVVVSLIVSVCVHSWAPWIECKIVTIEIHILNRTMSAYRHTVPDNIDRLRPYLAAKDWYNLMTRFSYAILLIIFTWTVIWMFTQRLKKRQAMMTSVSKRRVRRERSLFYLMVAVVIMTYIQVIPREGRRILELIYPIEYIGTKLIDTSLPIQVRRSYMLFGLYAYAFTRPILNLLTVMERSLLFYFYFILNHSFRREVLTLLHLKNWWNWVLTRHTKTRNEVNEVEQQTQSGRATSDSTNHDRAVLDVWTIAGENG